MSAPSRCPGCGGKKSPRARVCRDCRRHAGDLGVGVLIAGRAPHGIPPPNEDTLGTVTTSTETRLLPISGGKRDAFHAKCSELARIRGTTKAVVKQEILEQVAAKFDRPIESVNDLWAHEARWALDTLEELLDREA